jgi:hypothetical protein
MGDEAILQAVRTNEAETNTAYERAVKFSGLPSNTQHVLQRSLEETCSAVWRRAASLRVDSADLKQV